MAMDSSPFKEIERVIERMGRQVEQDLPVEVKRGTAIDVADFGDRFEVTMDLPGFRKENVELTLTDRTLHVEAERSLEYEETSGAPAEVIEGEEPAEGVEGEDEMAGEEMGGVTFVRKERRLESVSRSVELPDPVSEEDVEATLGDGVLTVVLPKLSAEEDARRIDID